ncbi:hypothetical protein CLLI_01290 [Clostridium liquoris]|jgi:hypothetical protein|uniref:Lantibiotic n=1 Tax=Clostridium liquoris TaxID=1289519 RepID=A0A2T0B9I3_9CLOT|nr:hypothetical protein [Clostridium liquoris]PRR80556.1 hypothetical protein CLLI_01290 [Clostridium liquoris]
MPNFEDFDLDLKKVKTNSDKVSVNTPTPTISYLVHCNTADCPSTDCSPGDMTIGCYAADKGVCRC